MLKLDSDKMEITIFYMMLKFMRNLLFFIFFFADDLYLYLFFNLN